MPTGFTAPVLSGEITDLRSYLLLVARAFCRIDLRDTPLDKIPLDPIKPEHRYLENAISDRLKIRKLEAMSDEQISLAYTEELRKARERDEKSIEESAVARSRVVPLTRELIDWEAPTDQHADFKKYAIDQLRTALDRECLPYKSSEYLEGISPAQWHADRLASAQQMLSIHDQDWERSVENTRIENEWIQALVKSLPEAADD